MNSKVKITIDVCDGEQEIELYSDPINDGSLIMNCMEVSSDNNFMVYLNKEEALLLSEQLKNQWLNEPK